MAKWRKNVKKEKKEKKKEGFGTIVEGLAPGTAPPPSSLAGEIEKAKSSMTSFEKNMSNGFASESKVGENLSSELTSIMDGIDSITKGNSFYSSLDGAFKPPTEDVSVYGNMNLNYLDLKGLGNTIQTMFSELSNLISYFFSLFFSYLLLIKKSIQLFIIEFNKNLTIVITKVANALTNNTATEKEIETFQDQTQKFLMMIMVWIFVYNWYFIAFYLKDEDNVRYTFDCKNIMNYSTILYGMIGPGCRVLEVFNWLIIRFAKTIKHYVTWNNLIYIGLFFLFLVLVSANLQYVMLVDFINAWNHKFGTSTISGLAIMVAGYYAIRYYFIESGMGNLLRFEYPPYIGYPLFFIAMFFYTAWTIAVNVPLGIFLVFGYLVLYSFLGVLFYQGTNTMSTFTGISENIANLGPSLKWNDPCINPPTFQWNKIPTYLWHYSTKIADWGTAYMFEIVIILMLLGGISIYMKDFQSSIFGKYSATAMSSSSIKQTFTYLFTWLILINVLIIAVLITWAYQKYKYITSEMPSNNVEAKPLNVEIKQSSAGFSDGNNYIDVPSDIQASPQNTTTTTSETNTEK